MSAYLQSFNTREDIAKEFRGSGIEYDVPDPTILTALRGATIHLAWYGYGSYCGSAFVLYTKNRQLYEVNGSHCSCYGLEGQWQPEKTSWKALAQLLSVGSKFYDEYDGHAEAETKLRNLVKAHYKEAK